MPSSSAVVDSATRFLVWLLARARLVYNNNNNFINVSRNLSMHANWRHEVIKVIKYKT